MATRSPSCRCVPREGEGFSQEHFGSEASGFACCFKCSHAGGDWVTAYSLDWANTRAGNRNS